MAPRFANKAMNEGTKVFRALNVGSKDLPERFAHDEVYFLDRTAALPRLAKDLLTTASRESLKVVTLNPAVLKLLEQRGVADAPQLARVEVSLVLDQLHRRGALGKRLPFEAVFGAVSSLTSDRRRDIEALTEYLAAPPADLARCPLVPLDDDVSELGVIGSDIIHVYGDVPACFENCVKISSRPTSDRMLERWRVLRVNVVNIKAFVERCWPVFRLHRPIVHSRDDMVKKIAQEAAVIISWISTLKPYNANLPSNVESLPLIPVQVPRVPRGDELGIDLVPLNGVASVLVPLSPALPSEHATTVCKLLGVPLLLPEFMAYGPVLPLTLLSGLTSSHVASRVVPPELSPAQRDELRNAVMSLIVKKDPRPQVFRALPIFPFGGRGRSVVHAPLHEKALLLPPALARVGITTNYSLCPAANAYFGIAPVSLEDFVTETVVPLYAHNGKALIAEGITIEKEVAIWKVISSAKKLTTAMADVAFIPVSAALDVRAPRCSSLRQMTLKWALPLLDIEQHPLIIDTDENGHPVTLQAYPKLYSTFKSWHYNTLEEIATRLKPAQVILPSLLPRELRTIPGLTSASVLGLAFLPKVFRSEIASQESAELVAFFNRFTMASTNDVIEALSRGDGMWARSNADALRTALLSLIGAAIWLHSNISELFRALPIFPFMDRGRRVFRPLSAQAQASPVALRLCPIKHGYSLCEKSNQLLGIRTATIEQFVVNTWAPLYRKDGAVARAALGLRFEDEQKTWEMLGTAIVVLGSFSPLSFNGLAANLELFPMSMDQLDGVRRLPKKCIPRSTSTLLPIHELLDASPTPLLLPSFVVTPGMKEFLSLLTWAPTEDAISVAAASLADMTSHGPLSGEPLSRFRRLTNNLVVTADEKAHYEAIATVACFLPVTRLRVAGITDVELTPQHGAGFKLSQLVSNSDGHVCFASDDVAVADKALPQWCEAMMRKPTQREVFDTALAWARRCTGLPRRKGLPGVISTNDDIAVVTRILTRLKSWSPTADVPRSSLRSAAILPVVKTGGEDKIPQIVGWASVDRVMGPRTIDTLRALQLDHENFLPFLFRDVDLVYCPAAKQFFESIRSEGDDINGASVCAAIAEASEAWAAAPQNKSLRSIVANLFALLSALTGSAADIERVRASSVRLVAQTGAVESLRSVVCDDMPEMSSKFPESIRSRLLPPCFKASVMRRFGVTAVSDELDVVVLESEDAIACNVSRTLRRQLGSAQIKCLAKCINAMPRDGNPWVNALRDRSLMVRSCNDITVEIVNRRTRACVETISGTVWSTFGGHWSQDGKVMFIQLPPTSSPAWVPAVLKTPFTIAQLMHSKLNHQAYGPKEQHEVASCLMQCLAGLFAPAEAATAVDVEDDSTAPESGEDEPEWQDAPPPPCVAPQDLDLDDAAPFAEATQQTMSQLPAEPQPSTFVPSTAARSVQAPLPSQKQTSKSSPMTKPSKKKKRNGLQ